MRDPFSGGEPALVRRLARLFRQAQAHPGVIGIGDDAAVLPGRPPRLITLDLLVEGQHFRWDLLTPRQLGVRALEVNLSDIAAMGGRPTGVFLGIAWPPGPTSAVRAGAFLSGFAGACRARGVAVLGGDTVLAAAGAATIAVTVLGEAHPSGAVLRSGGAPGDVLAVTGPVGGSAYGLGILDSRWRLGGGASRRAIADAVRRFRTPRARLDAAALLARSASALIDLSDGLGLDLLRLADASRCGFQVDAAAIPLHPALAGPARRAAPRSRHALEIGLRGGEDYELLAAIPVRRYPALSAAFVRAGLQLFPIGRLLDRRDGRSLLLPGAGASPWPDLGWDPFRKGGRALDASGRHRVGTGARRGPVGS